MQTNSIGIAGIFKNELPFIIEWLAYHRCVGVENFYIADNESDDGTTELLNALSRLGYLKYITHKTVENIKPQMAAYEKLASEFGNEVKWICFIDADEFIRPENTEDGLANSLSKVVESDKVGAVAINWALYGSSNWINASARPVIERFIYRAKNSNHVNRHYKTMVRTDALKGVGSNPHVFDLVDGYYYVDGGGRRLAEDELSGLTKAAVSWSPLRLHHYIIKSRNEFFTKKRPRGRPNGLLRSAEFFTQHDMNDERDEFDPNFIEKVIAEIDLIKNKLSTAGYVIDNLRANDDISYKFYKTDKNKYCIDSVIIDDTSVSIQGWVIGDDDMDSLDFKLLIDYRDIHKASRVNRHIRKDVARVHKIDPSRRYGFSCLFECSIPSMDSIMELGVGSFADFGRLIKIDINKSEFH